VFIVTQLLHNRVNRAICPDANEVELQILRLYCPISTESRGDEFMEEALFLKIMEDLSSFPYAGRISPHFYGEPTIDTLLVHLMRLARKMVPKAELIIHTNGTHLDRHSIATCFRQVSQAFLSQGTPPSGPRDSRHHDKRAQCCKDNEGARFRAGYTV